MAIHRIVSLYFSPTDATQKIVHAVAQGLDAPEALELNRTSFDSRWIGATLQEGDVAVIGVPVYYGRVPKIVVEFFRGITAKNIPAVLVVSYGNRDYEDALLELRDLSIRHGFLPIAAGAFVGQHSFTAKLGTGRPNDDDLTQATALGKQAKALLQSKRAPASYKLEVKGNFPYTPGSDLPIAPSTDSKKCNRCMACQINCPVSAINPQNPAEIDAWRCLACTRCIRVCPTGAKYIGIPALLEKIGIMEVMFPAPKAPTVFLAE